MKYLLEDLKKAVQRLEEVLKEPKNSIIRDSAIKRFELCFDLAWKAIKVFTARQGIECNSPRSCFKAGFQIKLLQKPDPWIEMLEDRNLTVHLYDEAQADEVYTRLAQHKKRLKTLQEKLNQQIKEE